MALSSGSKKSTQSDSDSDSDDEERDELPFLRQENERLGSLLDNCDDMLRKAKKMRKELRASLEDVRTRVTELETQVLDSKLEIDSLKASPVVSDETDCADCSIFLADLALFKEKHASKCEELDVLRVEVAEVKARPALLSACTSCPVLHEKIVEMHADTVSLEAKLKEPIPTSCSTCEMHALKNLEIAHYVDRLQDENDELRKLMGLLFAHEPQLRIMIETFKWQNGEGLGANKVSEGSEENIPEPQKTHHKNDFPPKPNHLRNRLDTTPAAPVFPPQTNDFQKPIKFLSTSGKVFFGKESEKASEEKPVEKPSGKKLNEQPKPKPKLVRFHCVYCGKEGHKDEFCFKRKREERMAKEWANKDRYNPSHFVPKPCMPLPRGKAVVRSDPAWGDASSRSRGVVLERAVRPAWLSGQTGTAQRGAVRLAWLGSSTGPPEFWVEWFSRW
jgi:predicted  nucleic acid-binding Zn-ribbon protein